MMYVKPGCPFCNSAQKFFDEKNLEYKTINYFEINRDEMDGLMKKTNNWPTAPMIFIDGNFYGGYQDLLKLDISGKLDEILKK